jgi:hypothetical protein
MDTDKPNARFAPATVTTDRNRKTVDGFSVAVIVLSVLAITVFLIYSVLMLYAIVTAY